MIRVERPKPAWAPFVLINTKSGDSLKVDGWDICGVASTFGWVPCDRCGETDGTVDCPHRLRNKMYEEAYDYLDECVDNGVEVEDPGYFYES